MKQLLYIFIVFASVSPITPAPKNKCCKDLGCFSMRYPWQFFLRPIPPPKCHNECPIEFYLFTRENPKNYVNISGWPPILNTSGSYFHKSRNTVILIHGWWYNSTDSPEYLDLKDAYLRRVDVNFLVLDWGSCSKDKYLQCVSTARVVAAQGIRFIKHLIKDHDAAASKMHIIGVSLGAQIASYIAKGVPGIGRLTGLDPAGPLFEGFSRDIQLDTMDAKYVDVGHTESLPFVGYGVHSPVGHVDFYFNGNLEQPGCRQETGLHAFLFLKEGHFSPWDTFNYYLICNHGRILHFYIEDLNNSNCTFWGQRQNKTIQDFNRLTGGVFAENTTNLEECTLNTCVPFGHNAIDYPARGSFFVATKQTEPYCIHNPYTDRRMARLLQGWRKHGKEDYEYYDFTGNNTKS